MKRQVTVKKQPEKKTRAMLVCVLILLILFFILLAILALMARNSKGSSYLNQCVLTPRDKSSSLPLEE